MGWLSQGMEGFCTNGGPAGYGKTWFDDWSLDQRDVVFLVRDGDSWSPMCRLNISPVSNLKKVSEYLETLLEATNSQTGDETDGESPTDADPCSGLRRRPCKNKSACVYKKRTCKAKSTPPPVDGPSSSSECSSLPKKKCKKKKKQCKYNKKRGCFVKP